MPFEHDAIPSGPQHRVVTATLVEGPPEKVEQVLGVVQGRLLSVRERQPGWQGTLGLASSDRRRSLVLTFWESEAALREGRVDVSRLRERAADFGVTIASSDRFEIVFDERVE